MTKVKIERTVLNKNIGLYELDEKDFLEYAEKLFLKLDDPEDGKISCACLTRRNFMNLERYIRVKPVSNIEIYYSV